MLAFNRNWVFAIAALGWCKLLTGAIEEAMRLYEQAMRLSPRDPYIANWYYGIGLAHLLQSRIDDAIVWYEKARHAAPSLQADLRLHLAAAYGLKGETERAAPNSPKHRD